MRNLPPPLSKPKPRKVKRERQRLAKEQDEQPLTFPLPEAPGVEADGVTRAEAIQRHADAVKAHEEATGVENIVAAHQHRHARAMVEQHGVKSEKYKTAAAKADEATQRASETATKPEGVKAVEPAVREPTRAYSANEHDPYTHDLFGGALPTDTGGKASRARRTGVSRDVQPAPAVQGDTAAPDGKYFTRTIVGTQGVRELGASRITSAADAAAASSHLLNSAVERLDGIVTDKDGKPLATIGGFKGALSQSAVHPSTLLGEAVRIPGATKVWFTHNHPSGNATLSHADRNLNEMLSRTFRGSGIEPQGLLAVGNGEFSHIDANGNDTGSRTATPMVSGRTKVPAIERSIATRDAGITVDSPTIAKSVARGFYERDGHRPGMILMDSQLAVIGWVPLTAEMTGKLRGTGGLNAIARAVSEANAGAAILVNDGSLDTKVGAQATVSQNIGAALGLVDVRLLDVINPATNESASNRGETLAQGPVYSRADTAADPKVAERAQSLQAFADQIASRWANAPEVIVATSMQDPRIPQQVRDHDAQQRSQGASGDPEGFFYKGKVYLLAEHVPHNAAALRVLMHEALGHYGLRSVFGQELGTILDRMAILNAGKVRTKARQYGLDFEKQSDRRTASEEVLAELAQEHPDLGWVKRTVAAIRSWMRDHVPGFAAMKYTDAELIQQFVLPARRYVKEGAAPVTAHAEPVPAYSRSLGATLASGVARASDVALPAGYKVGDLLNDSGKLSWWHKTVGTPFNLAERSPVFKKVYDATQTFLNDVSLYATEAADLAPRILPKLDGWKDIAKTPLSAADTKAVSAPIFEGTLLWTRDENGKPAKVADQQTKADALTVDQKAHEMLRGGHIDAGVLRMWQGRQVDEYEQMIHNRHTATVLRPGIVFTKAELKSLFKLNDHQASLYDEFRNATDTSLANLAISDMLRFAGKDVSQAVRDEALAPAKLGADGKPETQAERVDRVAELLRDHLFEQAKADEDRADVLNDTGNKMIDKADRATQLMGEGYAPLSRFGQYTLDVVDKDGARVYFGLFESAAERSKMARQMQANYPDATINQGTTSQEEYKLFAGVSPETLALFADMLGLEEQGSDPHSQVFQEYLKRAKNNRSAMKRLIERKGIAGFSEDAGRVLAGFVYSNARQTASNLHMGQMSDAVQAIPQGQGQLKDYAVRLMDYVKNPQQEAQALRGLLFTQYLGGSVASAMVNATQPIAVTFPYISQFVGVSGAGRLMVAAMKDAGKKAGTGDKALDAALKKAEEEGIVSPQEVHALQAQAAGRAQLRSGDGTTAGNAYATAHNVMAKVMLAWGQVFSVAEQFNRRVTFIAAYRAAQEKGIANPAAFAAKAVAETQFVYNKANKPVAGRGALGALALTFKQYAISFLELQHRMWHNGPEGKRAVLLSMAVLFLMSGTDGLPGSDDLSDLIDGFMQRLGYNWNTKQEKRKFFASILGDGGAQFAAKGLSGLPGAPIDVSGRISMGNLIPGTGLFTKKADHSQDLLELAGPAGDLAKRTAGSISALAGGDVKTAATGILPTAASNMVKAYDMATTGAYHDARGYKVIDTDAADVAAKAIGFQPNDVSRIQEATGEAQRYKALHQLRTQEISEKWAQGIAAGDPTQVAEAKAERDEWNAKNPDVKLKVNMPSILKRVREMRTPKAERIAETSPTGVRAKIKADLRESAQ